MVLERFVCLIQVVGMELFHVVGLAVFTFVVLPALDSCKALMVTNAVCLVPALLCE